MLYPPELRARESSVSHGPDDDGLGPRGWDALPASPLEDGARQVAHRDAELAKVVSMNPNG